MNAPKWLSSVTRKPRKNAVYVNSCASSLPSCWGHPEEAPNQPQRQALVFHFQDIFGVFVSLIGFVGRKRGPIGQMFFCIIKNTKDVSCRSAQSYLPLHLVPVFLPGLWAFPEPANVERYILQLNLMKRKMVRWEKFPNGMVDCISYGVFAEWARQLKFYGLCTNWKRRRLDVFVYDDWRKWHELDQAGKWRAAARNVIKCRLNYKQIKFTTPTSGRARSCCHDGSKNEWDLHSSERPRVDCARARPEDWRLVKLWYFVPKVWSGKKTACEKFKELDFLTPEMSILCRNSRSISILSSSSSRWMGTGILMENQCCIINTCVC